MERAKGQVSAALRAVLTPGVPSAAAVACLGLENVPTRVARLSPGMIYSLACDQQAVRLPLGAAALAASLKTGKRCVLLTPGEPAMYLRKARLAGYELNDYARQGSLALFQLAADTDKYMFRRGAEGLLRELEQELAEPGALLVFDQADPVFMLNDPRASAEAARAYLQWFSTREHTGLALFAPSAMAPREYLALRRIAENFAGFAVARSSYGGGTLEIRHWFAGEGASARETFDLRLHVGNVSAAREGDRPDELPPVESVICVREAMDLSLPGCREWEEVTSPAEALQAARRSEAATLVLPFRHDGDFPALCRTVAGVRAIGRPNLRVVIRERGMRLRAAHSLALMRLGTSSVLPMDVPDVAAKRIVTLMKETRFSRPYETDVQQVEEECGYCAAGTVAAVPVFCEAVEALLAAADSFDVEACLVRVEVTGAEPQRLLAQARPLVRDLIGVAKGDTAWLFLLGCAKTQVGAVMQRVLAKAAPKAQATWSTETDPAGMLLVLEALRRP